MTSNPAELTTSDITATVGFLLTLVGIIGTFFYVHLSNWLREILELKAKYDLNAVGETDARKEGRLECKFQLRRLYNHIPLLVAIVISVFLVLLCGIAVTLMAQIQPEPRIIPFYKKAGTYFLIIYFGLTTYFLVHGYAVAFKLRKKLR